MKKKIVVIVVVERRKKGGEEKNKSEIGKCTVCVMHLCILRIA